MKHLPLALLPLLFITLTGCVSKPAPYTVVSTTLTRHQDSNEFTKVYALDSDLHGNGWVMRRGTKITFGTDGSVILDTIVYAEEGLKLPNAVQLESIQYGPDGNMLFAIPGNDVGHSLHMRYTRRDYPVKSRFGYKRAYFDRISSVQFKARLLCEPGPAASYTSGKQG